MLPCISLCVCRTKCFLSIPLMETSKELCRNTLLLPYPQRFLKNSSVAVCSVCHQCTLSVYVQYTLATLSLGLGIPSYRPSMKVESTFGFLFPAHAVASTIYEQAFSTIGAFNSLSDPSHNSCVTYTLFSKRSPVENHPN